MSNRVTVPVRVHPDTRDEWHDFVDAHPEWDSVSQLIRGSVERERDGLYNPIGAGGSVDVDLDPVLERLESIDNKVDGLDQRVRKVEHRASDDPISNMAMDIREHIPTVDNITAIQDIPETPHKPLEERISTYGRVDDIVDYYSDEDTTELQVRQAMDRLRNDLPATIQTIDYFDEDDGETMRLCEVR